MAIINKKKDVDSKSDNKNEYVSYHTYIVKKLKFYTLIMIFAVIISFWSVLTLVSRYDKVPDFYVLSNPMSAPVVHYSDKGGVISPQNNNFKLTIRDRLIHNTTAFVYFYVNMIGNNAASFYRNLIPFWHQEYYNKVIRPLYIDKDGLSKLGMANVWSDCSIKSFDILRSSDPYRVHVVIQRIIQPNTNYQKIEYIEIEIDWKEVPQTPYNYIGLAVLNMAELRKEPTQEELEILNKKYPYDWQINP